MSGTPRIVGGSTTTDVYIDDGGLRRPRYVAVSSRPVQDI